MKRSMYVTMQILFLLPLAAWSQPTGEKRAQSGNAAMKYWQAIAHASHFG